MSSDKNTHRASAEGQVDEAPAEPESAQPEPSSLADAPPTATPPAARPSRTWPGTVALVLALVALGATGWLAYPQLMVGVDENDQAAMRLMEQQSDAIAALQESIEQLEQQDESLASSQQSAQTEIQRLEERSDRREAQLGDLEQGLGRVDERSSAMTRTVEQAAQSSTDQAAELADLRRRLEAAVEQMDAAGDLERETDRELRRQILMLEAAGLLRMGQDMAELQGDWQAARRAYERARDRLGLVDDARLEPVRRALAREIEALKGFEGPDLNSARARLERWGRESRTWPMQLSAQSHSEEPAEDAPDQSWRQRLGQSLGALVQVERRDALGRDEEQFNAAREQMQLRLLAAEFALVRRDQSALVGQIESILQMMETWFQPDAPEIDAARSGLEALAEMDLQPALPELGTALDQLQTRINDS